jgi:hypothetical protein
VRAVSTGSIRDDGKDRAMKQVIEGTGATLQEAIDDAIDKALKASRITDAMVRWRLLEATGERGGIASINQTTAKLEVDL